MTKYILGILAIFCILSCSKLRKNEVQEINKRYKDSMSKSMFNDPARAVLLSKKYLDFNKKQKQQENIMLGYGCLTMAFYNMNSLDSIMHYNDEALLYCKTPNEVYLFKKDLADVFQEYNLKDAALSAYEECLALIEENELNTDYTEEINREINFLRYEIYEVKDNALNGRIEAYKAALKGNNIKNLRYVRLYLIQSYLHHSLPDKTFNLIKEGLEDAEYMNNLKFQYLFHKMKAEAYLQKENFSLAYTSIKTAKEKIKKLRHKKYVIESEYVLARIYEKQGLYNMQVNTLENVICENESTYFERFSEYHKLLSKGYLLLNDIDRYIEYSETFKDVLETEVEENLNTLTRSHNISEEIKERRLKKEQNKKKVWIIAFIIVCIVLLLLFIRNNKIQKRNKRLFNNLMKKVQTYEAQEVNREPLIKIVGKGSSVTEEYRTVLDDKKEEPISIIKDDKVNEILEKLKKLETKHYFLKQDCTLHNTAKKLKTNTSYLSKIINAHLEKSFSTYINELRINYAIIELKQNKRLRSYTVKAIAEELGYKKSGAFSKYFKDATGITPSVYIKNLPEM